MSTSGEQYFYFNSQPHEEADSISICVIARIQNFNSQPHEEADNVSVKTLEKLKEFQLTASRRG